MSQDFKIRDVAIVPEKKIFSVDEIKLSIKADIH